MRRRLIGRVAQHVFEHASRASDLIAGAAVARGAAVGTIGIGGHAAPGVLHFGVRLEGEYINPLLLLGGVPRAVLLPCC